MCRVSTLWSGAVSSRIKGEESLFLSIRYTCTNINAIAKSRLAQSAVAEDHSLQNSALYRLAWHLRASLKATRGGFLLIS